MHLWSHRGTHTQEVYITCLHTYADMHTHGYAHACTDVHSACACVCSIYTLLPRVSNVYTYVHVHIKACISIQIQDTSSIRNQKRKKKAN